MHCSITSDGFSTGIRPGLFHLGISSITVIHSGLNLAYTDLNTSGCDPAQAFLSPGAATISVHWRLGFIQLHRSNFLCDYDHTALYVITHSPNCWRFIDGSVLYHDLESMGAQLIKRTLDPPGVDLPYSVSPEKACPGVGMAADLMPCVVNSSLFRGNDWCPVRGIST